MEDENHHVIGLYRPVLTGKKTRPRDVAKHVIALDGRRTGRRREQYITCREIRNADHEAKAVHNYQISYLPQQGLNPRALLQ
jgi:hypothetical protein